jgi:hypothetical protein
LKGLRRATTWRSAQSASPKAVAAVRLRALLAFCALGFQLPRRSLESVGKELCRQLSLVNEDEARLRDAGRDRVVERLGYAGQWRERRWAIGREYGLQVCSFIPKCHRRPSTLIHHPWKTECRTS